MPLTSAIPAPPISNLPDPAGGFEFDVAAVNPDEFRVTLGGAATVGAGKGFWRNAQDYPMKLREVNIFAGTAPTGADLVLDVNVDGTTAFSAQTQRPKLAAGSKVGSAVPAVSGNAVTVPPGGSVSIDVDQVGSTVAGADLTIVVELVKVAPLNREGVLY